MMGHETATAAISTEVEGGFGQVDGENGQTQDVCLGSGASETC